MFQRPIITILLAVVSIATKTPAQGQWQDLVQHAVRTTQEHGQRVIPSDLDGDDDIDLLCSYSLTDEVVLELNNGDGTSWQMVQIGDGIVAMFAMAALINNDSQLDIVAVGLFDRDNGFNTEGLVTWYERSGPINMPSSWIQHDIDATVVHPRYVDVGDMDNDNDNDIAVVSSDEYSGGGGYGNVVLWYENLGSGATWQRWEIASGLSNPESIRLIDINGGVHPEVVVAEYGGDRVLWYDSGGNPKQNTWAEHEIDTTWAGPVSARPYDMDGDSDEDVLVAFLDAEKVVWFEHPDDPVNDAWPSHGDAATVSCATEVVRGDLDNDGIEDIGSGSSGCGGDSFMALENDGKGGWVEHSYAYDSFTSVEVADVDGDGDLDALTSSYNGHRIDWWENQHSQGIFADGFESGDLSGWDSSQ